MRGVRVSSSANRPGTVKNADAPTLAAIEGSALAYTENNAATAITSTTTVADLDNTNLASATVQITGNCANPEDVLSFSNQNGITGSYTASTCLLTRVSCGTILSIYG